MKILVAGDFCPQRRVAELFEKNDFEAVLGSVRPVITDVDYAIVNLECPICYGGEKPIEKLGPNLKCSERGVNALKWAGFDCVTLANNHSMDYGEEGLKNTLEACSKCSIDTVGAGLNLQEASKILYKDIDSQIFAIINCCEHEFSIATDKTAGSNPLNPIQQYYAIKEARTKADYVLVIIHGGVEHYPLPTPRMQDVYRFFVDCGADVVINHHQHCYSGYEVYNGKPIFYGLGNLCFDWEGKRNELWNEGYIVKLIFQKECSIDWQLIPYSQCNDVPKIERLTPPSESNFKIRIKQLNAIISNRDLLQQKFNNMVDEKLVNFKGILQPYQTRLAKSLYYRGFLPNFLEKNRILAFLNYTMCESHLDNFVHALKKLI